MYLYSSLKIKFSLFFVAHHLEPFYLIATHISCNYSPPGFGKTISYSVLVGNVVEIQIAIQNDESNSIAQLVLLGELNNTTRINIDCGLPKHRK